MVCHLIKIFQKALLVLCQIVIVCQKLIDCSYLKCYK